MDKHVILVWMTTSSFVDSSPGNTLHNTNGFHGVLLIGNINPENGSNNLLHEWTHIRLSPPFLQPLLPPSLHVGERPPHSKFECQVEGDLLQFTLNVGNILQNTLSPAEHYYGYE